MSDSFDPLALSSTPRVVGLLRRMSKDAHFSETTEIQHNCQSLTSSNVLDKNVIYTIPEDPDTPISALRCNTGWVADTTQCAANRHYCSGTVARWG